MYPLFALFELPWLFAWILFGGLGIFTVFSVDRDNYSGATVSTLIGLALLHMSGLVNVIALFTHPLQLALYFAGYVVIGIIWSIVKWKSLLAQTVREAEAQVEENRESYFQNAEVSIINTRSSLQYELQKTPIDEKAVASAERRVQEAIENNTEAAFMTWAKKNFGHDLPTVKSSLGRVTGWAVHWVPSMLWTFIDDPVRRLFQAIVRAIGGLLTVIRNKEQAKLDKLFQVKE